MRPIFAKHISLRYSYKFCPNVMHVMSVFQFVCERVISGTTGPIAAKLCTHTPWMGPMNLCLKFST